LSLRGYDDAPLHRKKPPPVGPARASTPQQAA